MHRDRIKKMQSQIDTTVPAVCHLEHLRNNLKREQLMEERYYTIDRENKLLLSKMSEIMRPQTERSDRAKSAPSGPPSLNRDSRKTELMRITQENQAILKRIQQAQPVYNHVLWEDSYRRSGRYLKNSAEYPVVLSARGTSRGRMNLARKDLKSAEPSPRGGSRPDGSSEELRYVLKEGKKIGNAYYLVEMATDGRTLVISAYDGDSRKTKDLVVSEKNHRRLHRDANGDYNLIADQLYVEGDQLRLQTVGDEDLRNIGAGSISDEAAAR
jgi:hypothetical protein